MDILEKQLGSTLTSMRRFICVLYWSFVVEIVLCLEMSDILSNNLSLKIMFSHFATATIMSRLYIASVLMLLSVYKTPGFESMCISL